MLKTKAKVSIPKETKLIPFRSITENNVNTALVEKLKNLLVLCPADYQYACDFRIHIKGLEKRIKDYHKPMIDAAYASHKQACSTMNETLKPVLAVVAELDSKINSYIRDQERLALERKQQEEARLRKEAEEQRALEIEEAKKNGDKKLAKELAKEELEIATVPVETEVPFVSGVRISGTSTVTEVDIKKLCKAIADGIIPENCVAPVNRALLSYHKLSGDIPGVKIEVVKKIGGGGTRNYYNDND